MAFIISPAQPLQCAGWGYSQLIRLLVWYLTKQYSAQIPGVELLRLLKGRHQLTDANIRLLLDTLEVLLCCRPGVVVCGQYALDDLLEADALIARCRGCHSTRLRSTYLPITDRSEVSKHAGYLPPGGSSC